MLIQVLVVDDHYIVRKGIREFLKLDKDIKIAGEAVNGMQALTLIKELQPDVTLLDIEMPGMSGLRVIQNIPDSELRAHVLILSAHEDREYIQQALGSGAGGYLLKDEVPERLIAAIHGVAQGEKGWVSQPVIAAMGTIPPRQKSCNLRDSISRREMEVLKGIVEGKDNGTIAQDMNVKRKTVEKHTQSAFRKLGVNTRVEAAVKVVRRGWF